MKMSVLSNGLDGVPVMDYENIVEYVEEEEINIGIICVNRDNAQEVADKLSFAGVKGIWNFAPTDIEVPNHVALEVVHLSDSLHALAYHMNDLSKKDKEKSLKNK